MNIIIDIGNSKAKVYVFDNDTFICKYLINNNLSDLDALELNNKYDIKDVIVASTIDVTLAMRSSIEKLNTNWQQFTGQSSVPISILYKTPTTLGADRLAAILGASAQEDGKNILIIDVGTCVTIDILTAKKEYIGGNISPGIKLRILAMNEHTAKLPLIKKEGDCPIYGYDTETAMRSGVIRGIAFEVKGYIDRFIKQYSNTVIYITGGDSSLVCKYLDEYKIKFDRNLVAQGLNSYLSYIRKSR